MADRDCINEAMKAMALKIVKAHYPEMPAGYRGRRYLIALAAIMETQEACADGMREALERIAAMTPNSANAGSAQDLCLTVRAIAETALAGDRHG